MSGTWKTTNTLESNANKHVIVIGGTSGIGRAIAQQAVAGARPGRPEEIAAVVLTMMAATYMTGAVVDVDGGTLLV